MGKSLQHSLAALPSCFASLLSGSYKLVFVEVNGRWCSPHAALWWPLCLPCRHQKQGRSRLFFFKGKLFPQIAGSCKGSYFSMAGFLIAENVSRCRLVPCLPSLSPLRISLLAAAAALSPKLVSLKDFALGCRCCLVSQACLPSWFRSWLPLPPCLPSLSPLISLLPKLVSLHDFVLGCRCCLVSQACLPSWFRSWLPLSPSLRILSPFMISLLPPTAALSSKLVSLNDFALAARCRFVFEACLPWKKTHCAFERKRALAMVSNFSWNAIAIWGLCRYDFFILNGEDGKLRLLYEAAPMSFLMEQAFYFACSTPLPILALDDLGFMFHFSRLTWVPFANYKPKFPKMSNM